MRASGQNKGFAHDFSKPLRLLPSMRLLRIMSRAAHVADDKQQLPHLDWLKRLPRPQAALGAFLLFNYVYWEGRVLNYIYPTSL